MTARVLLGSSMLLPLLFEREKQMMMSVLLNFIAPCEVTEMHYLQTSTVNHLFVIKIKKKIQSYVQKRVTGGK